jgi:hypothetical protein
MRCVLVAHALVVVALLAAGCVSAPRVETAVAPPSFSAGALVESTRVVRADDLVRAPGTIATYAVLSGRRQGATLEQRHDFSMNSPDGRELVISERMRKRPTDAWVDSERMSLTRSDDGLFILREVATPEEDSLSRFDDGLAFAAPELESGESLDGASTMTVRTLVAGKPRGTGEATRSLRIVGECDINLCGLPTRAIVLELVFDVTLDVATAHVVSQVYVVPGRGIVAEVRREDVRILGIIPRRRDETIVLVDFIAPNPYATKVR